MAGSRTVFSPVVHTGLRRPLHDGFATLSADWSTLRTPPARFWTTGDGLRLQLRPERLGERTGPGFRLVNAAGGLVLGIRDMSTADGGLALQWTDSGTADHNWLIVDGTALRLRRRCPTGSRWRPSRLR